MSRSTTALVVPELNGKFELREVYLSEIQPDEVLVEIHASGLCHTDLSFATGVLPCQPGAVLGHEGAGVVLETGSAVSHVAPGDKVLLSFTHCETCPPCTSGHPAYCHSFNPRNMNGRRPDGSAAMYTTSHTSTNEKTPVFSSFFGQSSFARHTLAHRSCVVRIPADADLALYAPLGCGMQTGAGAVLNSLGVRAGSSVAVFGAGSVGMAAIMAAAHVARAAVVIAVDVQPERLELAKKLGATHTVLASREEGSGGKSSVVERIRELCPPVGVDFAVDCTGVPSVIRDMVDCLGTKGRASTVGAPGFGKEVGIDVMQHLTYGKEYVGCCEGDSLPSKFIPFLMDLHAKGRFPMEEFIQYYDFKDYAKAIDDIHSGKVIKAVLKWS